jgi:hypothetical protein
MTVTFDSKYSTTYNPRKFSRKDNMPKETMAVTYQESAEKEMLPSPKFDGVWWKGIPEEGGLEGRVVEINGAKWEIKVIGFQGTDTRGNVQMHPEPDMQEDVFMIAGEGLMWVWDGLNCGLSNNQPHEMKGVFENACVSEAEYALAIASYVHPQFHCEMEHLVLDVVIGNKTHVVEPISTPQGFQHRTELVKPSTYFVVKRKKV